MSINILYIEDNPTNTLLMRKFLERIEKYTLYDAPDAEAGIEMLKSMQPAVILMDIGLPGMDGFQAMEQIREQFDFAKDLPIVAVTADAMAEQVERAGNTEFFDYITKPIDFNRLLATLEIATEAV